MSAAERQSLREALLREERLLAEVERLRGALEAALEHTALATHRPTLTLNAAAVETLRPCRCGDEECPRWADETCPDAPALAPPPATERCRAWSASLAAHCDLAAGHDGRHASGGDLFASPPSAREERLQAAGFEPVPPEQRDPFVRPLATGAGPEGVMVADPHGGPPRPVSEEDVRRLSHQLALAHIREERERTRADELQAALDMAGRALAEGAPTWPAAEEAALAACREREGRLERIAMSFADHAEAAARAHEAPRTGMQVPFHGDFAGSPPSTIGRLRWWAREFRAALSAPQGETGEAGDCHCSTLEYVSGCPQHSINNDCLGGCANAAEHARYNRPSPQPTETEPPVCICGHTYLRHLPRVDCQGESCTCTEYRPTETEGTR